MEEFKGHNEEEIKNSVRIEETGKNYLRDFGLSWDYLVDKSVLDIGGNDGSFAAAAKLNNVSVTSIDEYPHLFFKKGISDKVNNVAANLYHLPFRDESFDFVCARYVIPDSSATDFEEDKVKDYIQEIMRVVKAGGEFRVLPAPFYNYKEHREVPIDYLRSLGYSVELITGHIDPYYIFSK